jgi:peptidoglycan hydrolase CwlO-like protein
LSRRAVWFCLALLLAAAWLSPPGEASPAQDLYRQQQDANAAVAAAAAQLAAADAALVRARGELTRLQAAEAATRQRLDQLDAEAAALGARLQAQRAQTDAVVRFLYENGTVSFLAVLLQSTTFADFLTRFAAVERLAAYDVGVLRRVADERQALQRTEAEVARAQADLAAEAQAQAAAVAALQQDEAARAAALAAARQQAAGAAAQLLALDRQLLAGLPQLDAVLAAWPNLPWSAVQPAGWQVAGSGVTVTVTDQGLNAALAIAPLTLAITPDGLSLGSDDIRLAGPVAATAAGWQWQPQALTVGGAPAPPQLLAALVSGRSFPLPLAAPVPGLQVRAVHLLAGAAQLVLGP